MFVGVGPSYKYQSPNNKFTTEFAALGGLGFINGGEILVEGKNTNNRIDEVLTYHSGFDKEKVFTFKTQLRFNYFFDNNWGAHLGAYYMNHFNVNESQKNQILIDRGIVGSNDNFSVYYYEYGTNTFDFDTASGLTTVSGFSGESNNEISRIKEQDIDQRKKIGLESVGVFAGITYRFGNNKKPKVKEEKVTVVEDVKRVENYCMQITAKDKFTNEILPNTDIALKDAKGEVVKTGKTDAFGIVKFCEIEPNNYEIAGVLNEINLESTKVLNEEFVNGKTLLKDALYTYRNFIVRGKAVECNSTTPISNISVVLENNAIAFKKTTLTDKKGEFTLHLPEVGSYTLFGKKDNYFSQKEEVNASNYDRNRTLFVKLEICAEKMDCGKTIGLKNILFDLNKTLIKEEAKKELNKLVEFMQDNPSTRVELSSHTDSRGSHAYNDRLSQGRADASVAYIVPQGISKNRIIAKGYGERQLLNLCADGVNCSEDEHAINRRTEFKVVCTE